MPCSRKTLTAHSLKEKSLRAMTMREQGRSVPFVWGRSQLTTKLTDQGLKDVFRPYRSVLDAEVMVDTGRAPDYGLVNFGIERSMNRAFYPPHSKDNKAGP
ncbi:hypothetical protein AXG93_4182s1290 [Marchantia polymorpha subsp. ruderalis]|uniref:RRM domain-containing protein n=1 Tax=Marchantia polymorpha subsp. ruderalis TaxID=1480154 RepID=A0A176VFU2_MARPO|nr:hypothetical protein AXG93_4182s1290 [Marchantia polymorpha subsp. ruderalis]